MSEAEMVPVTDDDRMAAEAFLPPRLWKEQAIADIAQAFARHRLAAEAAAIEKAAQVADERAEMRERLYEGNHASINAAKAVEAEEIATAIRSLKEGASHVG